MGNTKARKLLDKVYLDARLVSHAVKKDLYQKKRVKMIDGGYNGSQKEFRDVVVSYWKHYGINPKKYAYDIYCDGMEKYDPRFIPDYIWYKYIIRYFNDFQYADALGNKGMLDRVFPNVRQPETVVKNQATHFYTSNNKMITKEQAIELCIGEKGLVIKPTDVTGGGRNVKVFSAEGMSPEDFSKLFDDYHTEFIVQRFLKQHADLAKIHAESINTVRVMTFNFNGKINVLSAQLRMGAGDAKVDNITAGGCACPIKEDGWLQEKAVTRKSEWSDHHPSGLKFKDICVPSFEKIIAKATELHASMPYFHIIGWDFSVSEDGEPVMIEYNTGCEQNQIGGRMPTFGDLTEAVLEEVFIKKTLLK